MQIVTPFAKLVSRLVLCFNAMQCNAMRKLRVRRRDNEKNLYKSDENRGKTLVVRCW